LMVVGLHDSAVGCGPSDCVCPCVQPSVGVWCGGQFDAGFPVDKGEVFAWCSEGPKPV
jgi:hypothetical protein